MTQFTFAKDFDAKYSTGNKMMKVKSFKVGDIIEGEVIGKSKVATTLEGKMPDKNVEGLLWLSIPMENLTSQPILSKLSNIDSIKTGRKVAPEIKTDVIPADIGLKTNVENQPLVAAKSTIFTKKNIIIGLVVVAAIIGIWKRKEILLMFKK